METEPTVVVIGGQLQDWMTTQDWPYAPLLTTAVLAVALFALCFVVNWIAKRVVLRQVRRVVEATSVKWDDIVLEAKVFERLSHLAPALVLYLAAEPVFGRFPQAVEVVHRAALVYMLLVGIWCVSGVLDAVSEIYRRSSRDRAVPITAFVQMFKFGLYFAGAIFALSQILGKSPLVFFSGLGAFTAVLLLIFKDAILGFVAGIQISVNDMVRRGDWIEMPKYGVDGDVIDVTLTTVKVQNWDKTISTIPTYALTADSFRNWRGMSDSGGRRIKRSLLIDASTIRFCDTDMLDRFSRFELIHEYLDSKRKEVEAHNVEHNVNLEELINGRRLTNLGTFRAYVEAYLRNHPQLHQDMTLLVRQLAPTDRGIPIEIYVFSADQVWANYESIQADIFDHLLASVSLFDLRVYQHPSSADVVSMAAKASGPTAS